MFHTEWLDHHLQGTTITPENVQATLLELTARSVSEAIASLPGSAGAEIYVCGGGAHNERLLERLSQLCSPSRVASTASIGIDPQWVEAMAFAWLAQQTIAGKAGNIPEVTGAIAPRILGGVYPA
jgi:anhydro-N-acetylmuramic acid kinase